MRGNDVSRKKERALDGGGKWLWFLALEQNKTKTETKHTKKSENAVIPAAIRYEGKMEHFKAIN